MIRPYRPGDLWMVLPHIRQAELNECYALGEDPEQCLKHAIYSGETITLELNGEVAGLAGVVPCGEYWSPWSVFTEAIERNRREFFRDCKRWVSHYDVPMLNVVDEQFKAAHKWLKALGFTLGEPIPFGVNGELFMPYWKNFEGAQI